MLRPANLPSGAQATASQVRALDSWATRASNAFASYQDTQDTDASLRSVVSRAVGWSSLPESDKALLGYGLNELHGTPVELRPSAKVP
ncbi:hypothetical protein ACFWFZ_08375 [Streptomyces sp. NPDC060232]|uniref:hypothetical protein n=1 Tax=Streptomyces sp. NPDC060232 TaxID=3347079 RepID=UPI00365ACE22